jgi:hypothetical protein
MEEASTTTLCRPLYALGLQALLIQAKIKWSWPLQACRSLNEGTTDFFY